MTGVHQTRACDDCDDWDSHRSHSQFRVEGWPTERRVGFSCSCCAQNERVWSWSITELRSLHGLGEEIRERMSAQNAVDMKKKVAATRKAFKLLRRHLDDYQKMELKKFGHFHVRSSDGFLYRIEKASCWNVFRIEDGEVTANFCVIFENHLIPIPDQMLIQKFMLQSDPESFFRIANKNYDPQPRSRPRIIRTESGFANLAGVQRINVLENDVVRAA